MGQRAGLSPDAFGYRRRVEAGTESPSRWDAWLRVGLVFGLCVTALIRVFNVSLFFIPRWLALIVAVFAGIQLLSVLWNIMRGAPWNEQTFLDRVADALTWLPWGY